MDTIERAFIPALRWNWATKFYDGFIAITVPEKEIKNRIIASLQLKKGEKVLDFGCGTGTSLLLAHKAFPGSLLYGCDVDPKIFSIAQAKLPKEIKLSLHPSGALPYPDNSFDKIICTWVFHHLREKDKKLAVNELFRVLKPQGKLVLGDWGKPANLLMSFLYYILQLVDNFKTSNYNRRGELQRLFKNKGFDPIEEIGYRNTIFGTFRYFSAVKNIVTKGLEV